jgi:hypothetical protein
VTVAWTLDSDRGLDSDRDKGMDSDRDRALDGDMATMDRVKGGTVSAEGGTIFFKLSKRPNHRLSIVFTNQKQLSITSI